MYERIIVPLDGSAASLRAVGPAQRLARLFNGTPWIVVIATTQLGHPEAQRIIDDACPVFDGMTMSSIIDAEDPAVEVVRLARKHAKTLVCIATRGRRGFRRALLGSVAADVVRYSDQPVALVGPRCLPERTGAPGRIIACLDGTAESERVLPFVSSWVDATGVKLHLTHIVYPLEPPEARIPPTEAQWDELGYMSRLRSRLEAGGHQVFAMTVQHTEPPYAITDIAKDYPDALIAVATSGHGPLTEIIQGSTAAAIIAMSTVPVLVVSESGILK